MSEDCTEEEEEEAVAAEEDGQAMNDLEEEARDGADCRSLRVEWYVLKSCRQRRSGKAV